ncbi:unnamed protein product [Trichobilharzia regenti]|nr:unnamed protein product [Trichobilharzia regenti]
MYEEEKAMTNTLREEVKAAQKELKELESSMEYTNGRRRSSDAEQRLKFILCVYVAAPTGAVNKHLAIIRTPTSPSGIAK